MYEHRARLLAAICLLLILIPFGVVALEYYKTRQAVVNAERRQPATRIVVPEMEEQAPEKEETYVPPAKINYPLY